MTNRESMMPSNKQVEISYQATRLGKVRNKGSMHTHNICKQGYMGNYSDQQG